MSSIFLLAIYLFPSLCYAVCCKNSGAWWCFIGGVDCTPNCDDGHTYCNPASEVCNGSGNGRGECIRIVTETAIAYMFAPATTITDYTATVQEYSSTITVTAFVTVESIMTSTSTSSVKETSTVTVTAAPQARHRLGKRAETPTSYITITSSDDNFCYSSDAPDCTTTVQEAFTQSIDSTTTITSTAINGVTTVITVTSTESITETSTVAAPIRTTPSPASVAEPQPSDEQIMSSRAGTSGQSNPPTETLSAFSAGTTRQTNLPTETSSAFNPETPAPVTPQGASERMFEVRRGGVFAALFAQALLA